jgi:hypothetical protein
MRDRLFLYRCWRSITLFGNCLQKRLYELEIFERHLFPSPTDISQEEIRVLPDRAVSGGRSSGSSDSGDSHACRNMDNRVGIVGQRQAYEHHCAERAKANRFHAVPSKATTEYYISKTKSPYNSASSSGFADMEHRKTPREVAREDFQRSPLPQLRVEYVVEGMPHEREAQHHKHDARSWHHDPPVVSVHHRARVDGIFEHVAPCDHVY